MKLSLYSNRTRNPFALGPCVGQDPQCGNHGPNMNHHGPNVNPNGNQWNIVCIAHFCVGITLDMLISCCLSPVSLSWVANVNVVSGGIWA